MLCKKHLFQLSKKSQVKACIVVDPLEKNISQFGNYAMSDGYNNTWVNAGNRETMKKYTCTFVDQQDDDAPEEEKYPLGAWEYHSGKKLIKNSIKKPLRIFTHVSESDNGASSPESSHHNWVLANKRTAEVLKEKGYRYRFLFSRASGHCDRQIFEHTLADTLVWIWQGYQSD